MIKTIYLDMDGVIADFEKGCKDGGIMGDNGRPIWPKLFKAGPDFWSNLAWMPGAQTFYTWLNKFCKDNKIDLCILSAAGKTGWKAADTGKKDWLAKNCPDIPQQNIYIVQTGDGVSAAEKKAKHAKDNALLIDDFGKNINAFIMAGGQAIKYEDPKKVRDAILELV